MATRSLSLFTYIVIEGYLGNLVACRLNCLAGHTEYVSATESQKLNSDNATTGDKRPYSNRPFIE